MRTLKKTLCLVLCLAMMVGLCAFGASASTFTDDADIQNKEAVDLLQGIGILEGKPDGDGFKLDLVSTLTRGEACTIIYRLLGHGTKAYTKDTVFTDVTAAHWASGYIAFCYEAGIVAGVGHDLFKPNDPLTAGAWAKMLLCALGYDAETEGLTGTSWKFNTTTLVARTKLAEGLEGGFDASAEMNRDNAALLSYNALTVPVVEYAGGLNVSAPDGTTVTAGATRVPTGDYLAENFGLKVSPAAGAKPETKHAFDNAAFKKGVVTANEFNALDGDSTVLNGGATKLATATGEDLLGRYVIAYLDEDGNVLSVTEIGSVVEVEEDIKKDDEKTFKATFGTVKASGTVYRFSNGDNGGAAYKISADTATPAGTYVFNDNGVLVAELLDYAIPTLDTVKKIDTTAGKEYIELDGAGKKQQNADKNEVRIEGELAEKDVVVVKQVGALYYIEKAESVEGAITKFDTKTKAVTIDGTVYQASAAADQTALLKKVADPSALTAAQLKNNTYIVYLVDGEYALVQEKTAPVAPFNAYFLQYTQKKSILKDGVVIDEYYANVVDMAGEKSSVLFNTDGKGQTQLAVDALAGKLLAIEDDTTNGVKKLSEVSAAALTAAKLTKVDIATLEMAAKANSIAAGYVKDDTTFIFISNDKATNDKVEVKTGPIVIDKTAGIPAIALVAKDADNNNIVKSVFANKAFVETVTVDPSTTIYVKPNTAKSETNASGYVYTVYDVTTGEAKAITMSGADALKGKAGFYTFKTNDKGITTVSAYTIDKDTNGAPIADLANSNRLGATYDGKYENSIRIKELAGDHNASAAIFVDLRTAKELGTASKVTDIASLDKATGIVLDVLFSGSKSDVAIVFVRAS